MEARRREITRYQELGAEMVDVEIDVRAGGDVFQARYVGPATPADLRPWIAGVDGGLLEEIHAALMLGIDMRARNRAKAERRRKTREDAA